MSLQVTVNSAQKLPDVKRFFTVLIFRGNIWYIKSIYYSSYDTDLAVYSLCRNKEKN